MERSDLPDKLFAEDTLPHPGAEDGERPAHEEWNRAERRGSAPGSPEEDMLVVEYREDEIRTTADPRQEDLDAPDGGRTN